jgi:hypothetical protein
MICARVRAAARVSFTRYSLRLALLEGISVKTHSRPRSFRKAYPTGAVELSFPSAAGKFSRGTSTVTLKVTAVCGEGSDSCGW